MMKKSGEKADKALNLYNSKVHNPTQPSNSSDSDNIMLWSCSFQQKELESLLP